MNITLTDKQYRLIFEHRPGYLYACVEGGEDSYDITLDYWSRIAAECKETSYKRLLIEEALGSNPSMTDAYQVTTEIAKMGFQRVKIAFVDRFQSEQEELNQFGELVAVNRGLNLKVFEDMEEAEKWLTS